LILGKQGGCLPYVIAIVAALSVRDPLLRESNFDSEMSAQEKMEVEAVTNLSEEGNWLV
jgi:ATP-dependent RNA helicase DHX37/DHR1